MAPRSMRQLRPDKSQKRDLLARLPLLSNRFGIPVTRQDLTPRRSSKKASVQEHELEFIQRHIRMRQCISFIPKLTSDRIDRARHPHKRHPGEGSLIDSRYCQCGDLKRNHTDQAKANARVDGEWCSERDSVAVRTDAFGEVEFNESGEKLAKYVRADTNTSSEDIMKLLTEAWGLELPNLVISVTGSSVSFDTKSRLSDAFRHGLMKAASTTGAWILTGGTNVGITKVVGEAVRDFYLTSLDKVVAIGVAPWGCIQNRDILVQVKKGQPLTVPSYRARGKANDHMAFLDPNHSHFILADDGTRGRFGSHVPFRSKVLKTISSAKMHSDMDPYNAVNVPVCLLVVNGGKGTLQNVHEAVKQGIPTVIIKGSGKMADILAFAYQNTHTRKMGLHGEVHMETTRRFGPQVLAEITRLVQSVIDDDDTATYTKWIEDCMVNHDVISVLDFDARTSAVDVDLAILKALLKVNDGRLTNQLKLALVWNRIDIAESIVHAAAHRRNASYLKQLDDSMQLAIMLGNAKFVDLLLESGLPLKEFLTGYQLQDLYNNIPPSCLLHRLLCKERGSSRDFTLQDVGNLIKRLVPVFHQHEYIMDEKYHGRFYVCEQDEYEMNSISRDYTNDDTFVLSRHSQHLFVWALLMNKQELSKVFWRESREALAMALFAQSILTALMKYTNDKDELTELQNNADEYGELAFGVLSACYVSDPNRTYKVMTRFIPQWGNTNCMMLAFLADEKRFFAHMACQSLLDNIWNGSIEDENFLKILFCALFPVLLCCVRLRPREKRYITDTHTFRVPQRRRHQTVKRRVKPCPCQPRLSYENVKHFYSAPMVKFGLHLVFYITFLAMYSYLMLVKMDKEFNYLEVWLIVWVSTTFLEEIRQLCTTDGSSVKDKIKQYFFDLWNVLDMLTILLFTIGMVLRHFTASCGEESRIVLSLNVITFFLRLLHIFSINSTLGPILVMISSMVKDLMWFGIIVLMFLLSYGIASEAILCPNSELSWNLLYNVPRRAYWQLFGDMFLEDIEGDGNKTCQGLTRSGNCTEGVCTTDKGRYYVIILLGTYVLLTNVLLMNLVIAMFSNTFMKIQQKSDLHWCYQRYRLVYEYASRPFLPPPLIFISHVRLLFKLCYQKWKKIESTGFWQKLPPHEDKVLIQWENVIADNYIRFIERDQANSVEKKQEVAHDRLETILTKIDDLQLAITRLRSPTEPAEMETG